MKWIETFQILLVWQGLQSQFTPYKSLENTFCEEAFILSVAKPLLRSRPPLNAFRIHPKLL